MSEDDERLIRHMRDALVLARGFIEDERDVRLESFCCHDADGNPDRSTMGEDEAEYTGRADDLLLEIDAVLTLWRSHTRQPALSEAEGGSTDNKGGDDE